MRPELNAVITGASSVIGGAIATAIASTSAAVCIDAGPAATSKVATRADCLHKLVAGIGGPYHRSVRGDLTRVIPITPHSSDLRDIFSLKRQAVLSAFNLIKRLILAVGASGIHVELIWQPMPFAHLRS